MWTGLSTVTFPRSTSTSKPRSLTVLIAWRHTGRAPWPFAWFVGLACSPTTQGRIFRLLQLFCQRRLRGQTLRLSASRPKRNSSCLRRFDIYGINQGNLFPDLDGLSRHINWETRVQVERCDAKTLTDRVQMKAEIRCRRVAHCGSPFARAVTSRGATIRHGDETTTAHRGGGEREERLEPTVRTAKNEVSMRRLPRNRPTCAAPESARRPHAWPGSAQPWHPESSVASLPSCRQRPHIRKHPASRQSSPSLSVQ